jgi:hypothetical protein
MPPQDISQIFHTPLKRENRNLFLHYKNGDMDLLTEGTLVFTHA